MLPLSHPDLSLSVPFRRPAYAGSLTPSRPCKVPISQTPASGKPVQAEAPATGHACCTGPRSFLTSLLQSTSLRRADAPAVGQACCTAFIYAGLFPAGSQPAHDEASAASQAPDGPGSQSPLVQATQTAAPPCISQMAACLRLHADAAATGETAVTAGVHAVDPVGKLLEDACRTGRWQQQPGWMHLPGLQCTCGYCQISSQLQLLSVHASPLPPPRKGEQA